MAVATLFLLGGCIRISHAIPPWPDKPGGSITLSPGDGLIIPAQINGHPMRLRVDIGYGGIILNPEAALRAGLPESMFSAAANIGRVRVQGKTSVVPVAMGGSQDEDRRIAWYERPVTSGADGVISIAHLPYEVVTLRLRPAAPGEVPLAFETNPQQGSADVINRHSIGDKDINVRFSLEAPRSLVSAAAGALLAEHHGGTWSGDAFEHPIALEISRPVRPMRFARPVSVNGLWVDQVLVRTADYKGKYALPTDVPDPATADPSEIVVTGQGAKSRAILTAILGRDHLSACSSITYVHTTRILTLQCRTDLLSQR